MKITTKGQVTIPVGIRERYGFLPDTEIVFEPAGREVRIRKAGRGAKRTSRGRSLVAAMRGRGSVRLTTDQIMALTRG
jgi:bifunctional DNA-binding transcriptional regulator/antitoxin component of YhaV-PrlF toxin-antitoxin module